MTEHNRNRLLHRYHDACPCCYRADAHRRSGRYYCRCGAVWRWRKGSLKSPVICSLPTRSEQRRLEVQRPDVGAGGSEGTTGSPNKESA